MGINPHSVECTLCLYKRNRTNREPQAKRWLMYICVTIFQFVNWAAIRKISLGKNSRCGCAGCQMLVSQFSPFSNARKIGTKDQASQKGTLMANWLMYKKVMMPGRMIKMRGSATCSNVFFELLRTIVAASLLDIFSSDAIIGVYCILVEGGEKSNF